MRQLRQRPQEPHAETSSIARDFQPEIPFALSRSMLMSNLQRARRGAAAGPNGCTAEHFKVMLDDEGCLDLRAEVAERLAQARVPGCAVQALRFGRMVALRKPSGQVRGIVAGDVFRRMVSRTGPAVGNGLQRGMCSISVCSVHPLRHGVRAHVLKVITERHATATFVSIDGVGAFDHVSREATLGNLMQPPRACSALPFVRLFYGQPSFFLVE